MLPQAENSISEYDVIDIEMQSNILLILSQICENYTHHKVRYSHIIVLMWISSLVEY